MSIKLYFGILFIFISIYHFIMKFPKYSSSANSTEQIEMKK